MTLRVANFNVENLFSRYTILDTDPKTKEKLAVDLDRLSVTDKVRKDHIFTQLRREPINEIAQQNTAKIIDLVDADVICLEEVEGLNTLRDFAVSVLSPIQKKNKHKEYRYFMCVDGLDPRGIDVAIMSRYPLGKIETHMYEKDPVTKKQLFSRDCLVVEILTDAGKLHFLLNHFKSQISSPGDKNGVQKRTRQADRVAEIVTEMISDGVVQNFVVVGDFNDVPTSSPLKKLLATDVHNTIENLNVADRWTYIHGHTKQQLDYLLVSDSLKLKIKNVGIERRGLSKSRTAYKGQRLSTVEKDGTEASDHCAIYVDLEL